MSFGKPVRSVLAKARSWVGMPQRYCDFCGRDQTKVTRLVAGASAHICDSCIAECVAVLERRDILEQDTLERDSLEKDAGFDRPGPTQTH
jgi:hypothetical protein